MSWHGYIEELRIAYVKYNETKNIYTVFHNGFNYDYHFIIQKLAEEFKKNLLV